MISVIPKPLKISYLTEQFHLTNDMQILYSPGLEEIGNHLKQILLKGTGLNIEILESNEFRKNSISIKIDKDQKKLGNEGYTLNITPENILITAYMPNGVFYGIQSLRQLLPLEIESSNNNSNTKWTVPCVEIEDIPEFPWRGFMLDVGRHFYSKEVVKKIIDLMALMKMNVFHWHLIEDQGWRIEIKKYPKLTEIGSKRKETQIGGWLSKENNGIPHEGFYTQDDIREVVKYAEDKFIKVIPEIEMPGHCMSALAAYPEYSCNGGPFEVPVRFGIKQDVYCAGKESVFNFLENILDEVIELFPSDIIHIGGDEVPKKNWENCSSCQARIKEEGLKDEDALQVYFTNRIAKYLESKGKRVMGWNEILDENLVDNAIGQFWRRNEKETIHHMINGRQIVMSKHSHVYLDYTYKKLPVKKVYPYDPIPKKLDKVYHKNVLGIETPLWTEWVQDKERLFYQMFPRTIAIAETGWTSPEKKDLLDFKSRLDIFLQRLEIMGINYHNE